MQKENFGTAVWNKTKTIAKKTGCAIGNFFLKNSLGQCLVLGAFLVVILEILGHRSLIQGLLYPFTHPMAYAVNTMLVAMTFAISIPFKRRYFGFMLTFILWLAMGITNFVLLGMRVTPFEAADFYIITTGFSIITVYLSVFEIILVGASISFGIIALIIAFFKMPKIKNLHVKSNLAALFLLVCLTAGTILTLRGTGVIPRTVSNIADAYSDYGFAYCFSMGFIDKGINEPDDYNAELMAEIADQIGKEGERPAKTPNVIFVQLESFFDVNLLKQYTYSRNPVPNFTKLKEEFTSGYLTVPSIGAGTANTEFEVLTGMNLDFFGMGEYPYKSVLRGGTCESLATMFKGYGYSAHAIHNHSGTFYDRNIVYANLGFDSYISSEFMWDLERNVLTWAEDRALIDEVIRAMDSTKGTSDLVFTVSVQGHGRYPTVELDYEKHVFLSGADNETDRIRFEYYVNQMYEIDRFIGELTEAVTERGEETVIVFYGDHLPSLDLTQESMKNNSLYQTEYVIWSNFEFEKQLPDRDLYAYELAAYAMRQLDVTAGVMNRFHNYYFDQVEPDHDKWQLQMQALEYDMLYGNRYIYGQKNPFKPSDMRMGVVDIVVTDCKPEGEQAVVRGSHFTEFSVVYVDGDAVETIYLSNNELVVVEAEEIKKGSKIQVRQVASDLTELAESNVYIYK